MLFWSEWRNVRERWSRLICCANWSVRRPRSERIRKKPAKHNRRKMRRVNWGSPSKKFVKATIGSAYSRKECHQRRPPISWCRKLLSWPTFSRVESEICKATKVEQQKEKARKAGRWAASVISFCRLLLGFCFLFLPIDFSIHYHYIKTDRRGVPQNGTETIPSEPELDDTSVGNGRGFGVRKIFSYFAFKWPFHYVVKVENWLFYF